MLRAYHRRPDDFAVVADTIMTLCRGVIDDSVRLAPEILPKGERGPAVVPKGVFDPIDQWADALDQGGVVAFAPDAKRPRCYPTDAVVLKKSEVTQVSGLADLAARLGVNHRLVVALWPDRACVLTSSRAVRMPEWWFSRAYEVACATTMARKRAPRAPDKFVSAALVPTAALVAIPVAGRALRKHLRLARPETLVIVYQQKTMVVDEARARRGLPLVAFDAGSAEARAVAEVIERRATHLAPRNAARAPTRDVISSSVPDRKRVPHG